MAAKTFDEWVHDYMETPHSARSSGEWLRTAWDAATQAAEARLAYTNSAMDAIAEIDSVLHSFTTTHEQLGRINTIMARFESRQQHQ